MHRMRHAETDSASLAFSTKMHFRQRPVGDSRVMSADVRREQVWHLPFIPGDSSLSALSRLEDIPVADRSCYAYMSFVFGGHCVKPLAACKAFRPRPSSILNMQASNLEFKLLAEGPNAPQKALGTQVA